MMRWIGRDLAFCAGSAIVLAAALAWQPPATGLAGWGPAVAAALALPASVVLRRTHPLWSLCLAAPVALWNAAAISDDVPLWRGLVALAAFVAIHLAARRARGNVAGALVLGGVAAVGIPATVLATGDPSSWPVAVSALLANVTLPWLIGRYHWQRDLYREREKRMVAERERASERARIARDMHDSLGHDLGLIALRAGALELSADLDERHRAAAGELRRAAAAATSRLHQVIGVLRPDTGPETVRPAHESVAELVEHARAAGAEVDLVRRGPERPLGLMADRAAHRVVQEALTNAVKHAPGAPVTVVLDVRWEEVVVTVGNGPARAEARAAEGGERGLAGLRERVRLAGGTLRVGPRADGGFEVVARLPDAGERSSAPDADAGTGTPTMEETGP